MREFLAALARLGALACVRGYGGELVADSAGVFRICNCYRVRVSNPCDLPISDVGTWKGWGGCSDSCLGMGINIADHETSVPEAGCSTRQVRQRTTVSANATQGRRALEGEMLESEPVELRPGAGGGGPGDDASDESARHEEQRSKTQRRLAQMYAKHMEQQWRPQVPPDSEVAELFTATSDPRPADESARFADEEIDEETARLLGLDLDVPGMDGRAKPPLRGRQLRKIKSGSGQGPASNAAP